MPWFTDDHRYAYVHHMFLYCNCIHKMPFFSQNVRAEIFIDDSRLKRGGVRSLKNSSPLSCKSDFISFPAGFQPSFCVQCLPASPITAMAFRPSWGL